MRKIIYILIILQIVTMLGATEKREKSYRFVGFPFGFYKPETSFALGFGGGIYFRMPEQDNSYNTSEVAIAGFYSFKNYYSASLVPDLNLSLWRMRLLATLNFENNDDSYFGMGPRTSEDDEIVYKYYKQQITVEATTPSFFVDNLSRGFIVDWSNFTMDDVKDYDYIQNEDIDDNFKYQQLGLGFRLDYERRNNVNFPTKGHYFGVRYLTYREELGSDYEYNNLILDFKKFFPIKDNQVIANQIYSSNVSHNVPFMFLSSLGGDERMRGFYEGRFRDRNSLVYQLEYRNMFYKKWGAVAFANLGTIYSEFDDIERKDIKATFGIGGRFRLIPEDKINLRLDLAMGRNSFGFYFIIKEAF